MIYLAYRSCYVMLFYACSESYKFQLQGLSGSCFNVKQGSYFFSWFNGRSLTKYFTATYSTLPKLNKGLIDPWVTKGFKKTFTDLTSSFKNARIYLIFLQTKCCLQHYTVFPHSINRLCLTSIRYWQAILKGPWH